MTIRRERIGTVDISEFPPVLNFTFSPEQLWSSKMDITWYRYEFFQLLIIIIQLDGIPYDGTPVEIIETVDISLTVIFTVLSTIGIVFTIVCLAFNFIFKDRK
jgi:hypothetical protein